MSKKSFDSADSKVHGKFADDRVEETASSKFSELVVSVSDISTRKRAEEELREQQRFTQSLIEAAPNLTYIYDLIEHRNLYISPQTVEILGYTAEEISAMGAHVLSNLLHPDDAPRAAERLAHILNSDTNETFELDYRMRRKDGSWVWLLSRDRIFRRDAEGNPTQILGVATDITGRKQTESALRESEQRFRLATETLNIGVWEWNVLTDEIRWDTQMFAIYGIEQTADGLVNYTIWSQAVLPEDLPGQEAILQNTVKNSGNSRREFRIRRVTDGTLRYIEAVETVRTNQKGDVEWVIGTNIDVTTRKRAEMELRENKERFDIVKDSAEVGFWFCDLPFDVLFWDNRVKEHFWLPPDEEVTIDTFYEQLHPDDRERTRRAIDESIANRTQYEIEYRTVASDGREKWIRAIGRTFYDAQSNPIRFDGVTLDITERKHREENIAFLADIAEDFARLTTADEILQVVGDKTARYLGISNCVFAEIDEDCDEVNVICAWRGNANSRELIGIHCLSDYVTKEFQDAARRGETVVIYNTQTDKLTNAEAYSDFDIHSFITVPFRRGGKWKYLFTVNHNSVRDWRADEIELVKELTGRIFPRLERARAEEALQKSENEFRTLANAVPQIVWVSDAAGKIEFVNDIWTEFSGLNTVETATPEIVSEIIHPEDRERVFGDWAQAFELGKRYEVEARMKEASTGDYCWFLMRSEPTKDEAGNVVKWFGTSTDITERKRTEQELGVQRRLYQSITDNATTALFIMDEKQQCMFMNPAAEKLTGYSFAETVGRALHDVLHHTRPDGSPFPLAECPIDQAFPTCNQMQGEEIFVHKNGHFYDVAFTASPLLDENGIAVGTVIEVQDITHRKEAEREREKLLASEREARQQAESANRLKDEFLATVSHELRTPLNAIYGWSTMVRNSNYDYEVMRRAFEVIERSARNQNQIISDILDVSRIITGKLNLNLQLVALSQVIFAAVDTVRPAIDAKEIQLEVQLDPDAEIITGDADRLQQIVWNLLSNAVKFTPDSGKIKVTLDCAGDYAKLSVADNGAGIEAEFLPFVFDRFRQADGKKNRQHGGLGLGLAIVRSLVELHGGSVLVESVGLGRGATFTVRLPLKSKNPKKDVSDSRISENAQELSESKSVPKVLNGLKILVVDDQTDALELAAFILTRQGAKVLTADSADQALEIFENEMLDAIVSDIGMPQKDGYELIRQIKDRQDNSSPPIPVIALTAYAGKEDNLRVLESGFAAYLPKPVEPRLLVEMLAEVTKNSD